MGKASRDKGQRGERMWRDVLRGMGCADCHRGRQYCGGPDSPDIAKGIPHTHGEVKFTEKLQLHAAMRQAIEDAGEHEVPYVASKRSRDDWLVTVRASDLMALAERLASIEGKPIYPVTEHPDGDAAA